MKTLFRQLLVNGGKVVKTLTFWSVILGTVIAIYIIVIQTFLEIWGSKGSDVAFRSSEYRWLLPLTIIVFGGILLFHDAEKKQITETEASTGELASKLDIFIQAVNENTEELKKFISTAVQIPHKHEGDSRPDNQSNDKPE